MISCVQDRIEEAAKFNGVRWTSPALSSVAEAETGGRTASKVLDKQVNGLFICDCALFFLGIVPGIVAVAVDFSNDYSMYEPAPSIVELKVE